MPQRSNLFQRLALLVHKTLDPEWEVTESEMLLDSVTGQNREVDIVAKRTVMEHQVVLSVECRDHRRAADVTWIESMAKKHEHLPTSKLVLWSHSGFTRPALLKAKVLKIDTVSQAEATVTTWAQLARDLLGGYVQHVAPTFRDFVDVTMPDNSIRRYDSIYDWKFFDTCGVEVCSVSELIQYIANNEETRNVLLDNAPSGSGSFWAEFVPPTPWFADITEGHRCLANRIGVGIDTVSEKVPLETRSAFKGKSVVTLASATIQSGTLEFIIQENQFGSTQIDSRLVPKKA